MFCSPSSAETQWVHLLRKLAKLVDNKDYSDEINSLNWEEKSRLIQSDPVIFARLFDYQINQFIHSFLLSKTQPLGKIADYFYRVEYQQRGSPHIHMLIFLENAPTFGEQCDDDITSFILLHCGKPPENSELFTLVNRQTHGHSPTCKKKSQKVCRFNYPQPPVRSTQILYPLDVEISGVASSIIEGVHIHILVFTDRKSNRFQKRLITQNTNNYRSFYAACTDTFLRRIYVYCMIGSFQLSRADYALG